jgi:hypothetical protein
MMPAEGGYAMSTYAALIWCGVWTGLALGLLAVFFWICDGLSLRFGRRQRTLWAVLPIYWRCSWRKWIARAP